jgi:Pyruvate/2-oxoacid:ferredoxin oxidoreductase gamma subunit
VPFGEGNSIFVNMTVQAAFLYLTGEISTQLIQNIEGRGSVQLIYYKNINGIKTAFIRVYRYFNPLNSKVFRDYYIGVVPS